MKKLLYLLIILMLISINYSCTQKQAPSIQEQQVQQTQTETTDKSKETRIRDDRDKPSKEMITEKTHQMQQQEDIKSVIKELQTKIKDIYFDFDKYDIDDKAKPVLKQAADLLIDKRKVKIIIEGHCDERGTREYNLGLGERRANAARDYLISLGIPSKRIEIVSYGKEKPQCTEKTEECWAKNRRAHFVFIEDAQ